MNVSNTFATVIFVVCLFVFGLAFALLLYDLLCFSFLERRLLIAFLLRRNRESDIRGRPVPFESAPT